MTWKLIATGNVLTAITYSAIAVTMWTRLRRTAQFSLRANPLGVAMTLVFLTVAVRAAWAGAQLLLPSIGVHHEAAIALRHASTPASLPLPFLAAAAGALYLVLRRRAGDDPGPASLYPDHALERRRALEINDNIVQDLIAARELDALGRTNEARHVLQGTLERAQRMSGELLDGEIRPGDLRRAVGSGTA